MTYGAFTPRDFPSFEGRGQSRQPISQAALCAVALCASTAVGLWLLYGRPTDTQPPAQTAQAVQTEQVVPLDAPPPLRRDTAVVPALPSAPVASVAATDAVAPRFALRRDAALLNPMSTSGYKPVTFAQSAPLRSAFEPLRQRMPQTAPPIEIPVAALPPSPATPPAPIVAELAQDVPLPTPRPADLVSPRPAPIPLRTAQTAPAVAAPPAADHSTFFDRLFRPALSNPGNTVLAYAAPEDGGLGQGNRLGRPFPYDRWTAVYVISTHTVYLPDGTQLEAHSGLGNRLDDPRSVAERMRGATPPNVYDLQEREALFHGVRALRLNPADANGTYGRGGLLAHTFMLGPRGDSNGCVVFRNYKAFLQAYDAGAIRRLAVVARLN